MNELSILRIFARRTQIFSERSIVSSTMTIQSWECDFGMKNSDPKKLFRLHRNVFRPKMSQDVALGMLRDQIRTIVREVTSSLQSLILLVLFVQS